MEKVATNRLTMFLHERLSDYMSAYDSEPENWEGATPEGIREDVMHGSVMFIWRNLEDPPSLARKKAK
jgi:hypothetical protein